MTLSQPANAAGLGDVFPDPLPQRINFQHLLENKDIALGEVQAFLQDSQGFMWIGGGGGLIRYDGYEFKFILATEKKENKTEKLPVKMVNFLYEDSDKILWVLTRTGLLRYDPHTELLTPVADNPSQPTAVTGTYFYQATEVSSSEILFATANGLLLLDKKNQDYTMLLPDNTKKDWLYTQDTRSIYRDKSGILWVGSTSGLERFDWSTKKVTLFKPFPEKPELVDANTVNDIVEDKNGSLWLGTTNGLVNFDPATRKSTRYINEVNNPNSIAGKEIAKLIIDSNGALWVASDGYGLAIFERTDKFPDGRFSNQRNEDGRVNSLSSNQVRTVYEDRSGDVWVGNYPVGINYFDRSSAAVTTYQHNAEPNSLSFSAVLAVREDTKGNLWLGTDGGGLNFFDREKDQFISYKSDPANDKTISGYAILDVFIADDGKVWAGTWAGGISVLDPATGLFTRMPFDAAREKITPITTSKQLNNATVWSIKQDRQKNIWIGTHSSGLSKYDPKTETYTHYITVNGDPNGISPGPV